MDGLHSSPYFQVFQSLYQFLRHWSECTNYNWYHFTFMLHSFFNSLVKSSFLSFVAFFWFYPVVYRNGKVHYLASSLFLGWGVTITRSGCLAEIRWFVCVSFPLLSFFFPFFLLSFLLYFLILFTPLFFPLLSFSLFHSFIIFLFTPFFLHFFLSLFFFFSFILFAFLQFHFFFVISFFFLFLLLILNSFLFLKTNQQQRYQKAHACARERNRHRFFCSFSTN